MRAAQGLYQNNFDKYLAIPENVDEFKLGESVEGRDIYAYKFENNSFHAGNKIKVLFLGGIHGNDVGTIKLMHRLIFYLAGVRAPLGLTVYVIPCLNVDGHVRAIMRPDYVHGGVMARLNANEVDLNCNFDTKSFQIENYGVFEEENVSIFCGEKPFSEPESKLLADFVLRNGISVLYSFQAGTGEVIGGKNKLAERLVKEFTDRTKLQQLQEAQWKLRNETGTLKEWCDENNVAYIGIGSHSRYGSEWKNQKNAIINAIKYHYG